MHTDTAIRIAAQQANDLQAEARAAHLAGLARTGRAGASLPGSGSAVGGRYTLRRRLLGRWVPGLLRPA